MIYDLNLTLKSLPELQGVKYSDNRAFLEYRTAEQGTVELRRGNSFVIRNSLFDILRFKSNFIMKGQGAERFAKHYNRTLFPL